MFKKIHDIIKNNYIVIIIILVYTIILLTTYLDSGKDYRKTLTERKQQFIEERAKTDLCQAKIDKYQQQINNLVPKDFYKLKLVDDIKTYIDLKYSTIPNVVINDIATNIVNLSHLERVSPNLVIAIIEIESGFNPMAISKVKARGLMQVMPEWVKKIEGLNSTSDLFNIDCGIRSGIRVLKIHLDENNGNIEKALYDYSGKSRTYVMKIFAAMGKFIAYQNLKYPTEK